MHYGFPSGQSSDPDRLSSEEFVERLSPEDRAKYEEFAAHSLALVERVDRALLYGDALHVYPSQPNDDIEVVKYLKASNEMRDILADCVYLNFILHYRFAITTQGENRTFRQLEMNRKGVRYWTNSNRMVAWPPDSMEQVEAQIEFIDSAIAEQPSCLNLSNIGH
ncbi:MAG: hypothetical protein ACRCZF_25775, partial [Gemmataceae bacterium]